MSGGMEDGAAVERLARRLHEAACELRDAIREAEEGHRGLTVSVRDVVNGILLEQGWKLVQAEAIRVFR